MNRDRYINIRENLALHVRIWDGDQTPFVLVHGLSSNCRTWEAVAEQLAAAGHFVVTVDQRGHGLSDKPDAGYDFNTVTDDLARLLDDLKLEQPIIAGQSWGGNVMLAFGVRHPQRARGLAFIDGGYIDLQARPDGTWVRIREQLKPPHLIGTPRDQMKARMINFHPDWTDQGIEAQLANFESLPDGTVRPWLTLARHMQILYALWEQRPPELYPYVTVPVLICAAADQRDSARWVIKQQQVAAAETALPTSAVHWFENADHDIHVQRPDELSALFLDTLSRGIWSEE